MEVSHSIINLGFPIPINKAVNVLIDQPNNDDIDNMMRRTKLCFIDIYKLAELFLSNIYFNGTAKLGY